MSIGEQELLRGELWRARQEIKKLRAKLRKARRPGNVLARGIVEHPALYPRQKLVLGIFLDRAIADGSGEIDLGAGRVEVREVPRKEAGR